MALRVRLAGTLLVMLLIATSAAVKAMPPRDPDTCPRDSKLIGAVSTFGDENEASIWNLLYNGMLAAGLLTSDEQRDYLNGVFGTSFATLDEVKLFNLQVVSDTFDKNGNGIICAFDLRGTRAYITDPYFEFTYFGGSDDKIRK